MRYLFIGGAHDGEWHEVAYEDGDSCNPRQRWELADSVFCLPDTPPARLAEINISLRTSIYHRQEWKAGSVSYWVFTQRTLQPHDVLLKLLHQYQRRQ